MSRLRIALCQLDPVVGDLSGNAEAIITAIGRADDAAADLAVFGELAITGYPPEDLLLKPGFVADNLAQLSKVASATRGGGCVAVVGFVAADLDLFNAAAICAGGEVVGVYRKQRLPNYGVFDEQRYFAAGSGSEQLYCVGGVRMGVSICEDLWDPAGPVAEQAAGGAELIVNINASPYHAGRLVEREHLIATRAADSSCPLVYLNQVGGQDELVFDGASMVVDPDGRVVAALPQFEEVLEVVDLEIHPAYRKRLLDPRGRHRATRVLPALPVTLAPRQPAAAPRPAPALVSRLGPEEEIYRALVLGTADYVRKNGFAEVAVGLSGGVDSSLVAVVAADALGADRVHTVAMPSRYSSDHSLADATALAAALGVEHRVVPIEPAHVALTEMLASSFEGRDADLTEENLQSRIPGVVLMALSNKFGWLVLTTGNKSELAVGYSTLYGDTAGGFAVIRDVPKTLVYRLCRWRNTVGSVIPERVLSKAPSAELRPDQRDDQSLPPYELLDPLLEGYVEGDRSPAELVADGFDAEIVERVVRLVDAAEYKRRQGPPGVRVTPRGFGKDRRVPITNRYR